MDLKHNECCKLTLSIELNLVGTKDCCRKMIFGAFAYRKFFLKIKKKFFLLFCHCGNNFPLLGLNPTHQLTGCLVSPLFVEVLFVLLLNRVLLT